MPNDSIRRRFTNGLPGLERTPTVVAVGGEGAKGLATHLGETCDVLVVSDDADVVKAAERDGIEAAEADVTSGGDLAAQAGGMDAAVVAAERDRVSFLAAQLLRTVCDVEDVAVLLNDPTNRELFADVDVTFLDDRNVLGREVERVLFDEPT